MKEIPDKWEKIIDNRVKTSGSISRDQEKSNTSRSAIRNKKSIKRKSPFNGQIKVQKMEKVKKEGSFLTFGGKIIAIILINCKIFNDKTKRN